MSKNVFGWEKLAESAGELTRRRVLIEHDLDEGQPKWAHDSEIEKLMADAMQIQFECGLYRIKPRWYPNCAADKGMEDEFRRLLRSPGEAGQIHIGTQVVLEGWRVDFLVAAAMRETIRPDDFADGKWVPPKYEWQCLIVECDGHDFHERTKAQAKRDRSRDRKWQQQGVPVFRFTGSEIWTDPLECARQVAEWSGWHE
jgi:hypothetical protein